MGLREIISKLHSLVLNRQPFSEESQVVYFMVEIRKILERECGEETNLSYPLIKFYCDWVLHTEKTKITPEIKEIINRIDSEIPVIGEVADRQQISQALSFIRMSELAEELKRFFYNFGIPPTTIDEPNWTSFVKLLISILVDQPIILRDGNIKSFSFILTGQGEASWFIEFKESVNKHDCFYEILSINDDSSYSFYEEVGDRVF
jgi:hypothetical protein